MDNVQISLVKQSWKKVASLEASVVGTLFYNRLFEIDPTYRSLFRSPVGEQSRKLLSMIGYIISRLDRQNELVVEIQRLASRHVQYGVTAEDYTPVGNALIWTLEKGLGAAWNKETEEAWICCYAILSSAMINAAQEAVLP